MNKRQERTRTSAQRQANTSLFRRVQHKGLRKAHFGTLQLKCEPYRRVCATLFALRGDAEFADASSEQYRRNDLRRRGEPAREMGTSRASAEKLCKIGTPDNETGASSRKSARIHTGLAYARSSQARERSTRCALANGGDVDDLQSLIGVE